MKTKIFGFCLKIFDNISLLVQFLSSFNDIDERALKSVKYVLCGVESIAALDVERLRKK